MRDIKVAKSEHLGDAAPYHIGLRDDEVFNVPLSSENDIKNYLEDWYPVKEIVVETELGMVETKDKRHTYPIVKIDIQVPLLFRIFWGRQFKTHVTEMIKKLCVIHIGVDVTVRSTPLWVK